MKYACVLLCCFILTLNAYAQNWAEENNFSLFIKNLNVAHIDFVQTKILPDIKRVFKSTGTIKFIKGEGFIWQQKTPKELKFISTKEYFCIGETNHSLDEVPQYSDMAELIEDVLNGNFSTLNSAFDVSYTENDKNSWQIVLIPKIDELKNIFKQISLIGNSEQIIQIKFEYINATIITVQFSPAKVMLKDEIKC